MKDWKKYYPNLENIESFQAYIEKNIGLDFFESVHQPTPNEIIIFSEKKNKYCSFSKYSSLYEDILDYEIKELISIIENNLFFSNKIKNSLLTTVCLKLDDVIYKTIIFEANEKKRENISFEYYIENVISTIAYKKYFFNKYQELFRIISLFIKNVVEYFKEIILNITKDFPNIEKNFGKIGIIDEINIEFGDAHNDQKSTARIVCSNAIFFYKPREMKKDIVYLDLLSFVCGVLEREIEQNLKIIDCGEYGYQLCLDYGNVGSDDELMNYFFNSGTVLCLTYFLELRDLHHENIIATITHPALIDLEVMLNNPLGESNVLQTGLLPSFSFYGTNVSGFGSMEKTIIDKKNYRILETEKIVDLDFGENIELERKSNQIRYKGIPVKYRDYVEDIQNGFEQTLNCLQENFENIKTILQPLVDLDTRKLVNHTSLYSKIIGISLFPEFLTSTKKRMMILLKALSSEEEIDKKKNRKLILSLLNLEIPMEYERIELDWKVLEKKFSDIVTQTKFIESAFYFENRDRDLYSKFYSENYHLQKKNKITSTKTRDVIKNVVNELSKNKININGEVSWVRPIEEGGKEIFVSLECMDNIYYDGISGVLDFICDCYFADSSFVEIELIDALYTQLYSIVLEHEKKNISIGFYQGYAGIIYTLIKADIILQKNNVKILENLLINKALDKSVIKELDLFTGYGGLLLGLINIKKMSIAHNSRLSEAINSVVKKILIILSDYEFEYNGFAHGALGISTVLFDSLAFIGNSQKKEVLSVLQVINKKINQFEGEEIFKNDSSIGWCHGIVGFSINQCKMIELGFHDATDKNELEYLQLEMLKSLGHNISICHGDIGILLALEQTLKYHFNQEVHEKVQKMKRFLFDHYDKDWFLGYGYFVGIISMGILGLNEYLKGELPLAHLNFMMTR